MKNSILNLKLIRLLCIALILFMTAFYQKETFNNKSKEAVITVTWREFSIKGVLTFSYPWKVEMKMR